MACAYPDPDYAPLRPMQSVDGAKRLYVLSRACERSGKRRGASQKSGGLGVAESNGTGAESGERSGNLEVTERERAAKSGGYRNRFERGAAFSPLTLRSPYFVFVGKVWM